MMFLILCFQAILGPENILQRIDDTFGWHFQNLAFCMSTPRLIDVIVGSVGIRKVPYTNIFRGY